LFHSILYQETFESSSDLVYKQGVRISVIYWQRLLLVHGPNNLPAIAARCFRYDFTEFFHRMHHISSTSASFIWEHTPAR